MPSGRRSPLAPWALAAVYTATGRPKLRPAAGPAWQGPQPVDDPRPSTLDDARPSTMLNPRPSTTLNPRPPTILNPQPSILDDPRPSTGCTVLSKKKYLAENRIPKPFFYPVCLHARGPRMSRTTLVVLQGAKSRHSSNISFFPWA